MFARLYEVEIFGADYEMSDRDQPIRTLPVIVPQQFGKAEFADRRFEVFEFLHGYKDEGRNAEVGGNVPQKIPEVLVQD